MGSSGGLGGSLDGLGVVFKVFKTSSGALGSYLELSWSLFESSWSLFGALGWVLGALRELSGTSSTYEKLYFQN